MSRVSSQNLNSREESDCFIEPRTREFDLWSIDIQEVVSSRINSPGEMGLRLFAT